MKIKNKIILILSIIFAAAFFPGCIDVENNKYPYEEKISGVDVYSDIPISEVESWDEIVLLNKEDNAVTRCNLEISAVSLSISSGPEINVVKNDKTGIYIHENSAEIKGASDEDIMEVCHVFVCLKEGVSCPENLNKIKDITSSKYLNVVIDGDVMGAGVRGYAEIMMALGYLQSEKLDSGKASFIFPYVKENNVCKLQPFYNKYQIINETSANETVNNCNINGIFIQKSDKNEIKIEGEKIILSGDDEHLYTEAIIVRDIIAPDLVLQMMGG